MSLNRTGAFVVLGLLILSCSVPAFAQGPLGMQLFAPADVSTFGGAYQQPNEGYFFQYDILLWNMTPPKSQVIGKPGLSRVVYYGAPGDDPSMTRIETSTLDTSNITEPFRAGNRFEFGRVEDRNGWFCSIFSLQSGKDSVLYDEADVVFEDPAFGNDQHLLYGPVGTNELGERVYGNLPVVFNDVQLTHRSSVWGVELMYLHRLMTCHDGGTFEFFVGPRYIQFKDDFNVTTDAVDDTDVTGSVPSFLGGSWWTSKVQNNIIGPELGVRWSKKQGRWMLNAEGRFVAGFNCQNIHMTGIIGPDLTPGDVTDFNPLVMGPSVVNHGDANWEWSPVVELRLEGRYQITRAMSFHAGWTGFWLDSLARGDAVIDYTVPNLGIDLARNRQNLIVNGLTLGVDFNR